MGAFWQVTLNSGKKIGVKRQLEHVVWGRFALQLGVRDFIGEWSKFGRDWHTLQKVRIATPYSVRKRALIDDVRSSLQSFVRGVHRFLEGDILCFDPHDRLALGLKSRKILGLMLLSASLQQDDVFTVLDRREIISL